MPQPDLTGPNYRAALHAVRATNPDAAEPIQKHVRHLEQRLARAQSEHSRLDTRIKAMAQQAIADAAASSDNLMVVTDHGSPVAMSSSDDIAAAATTLLNDLRANRNSDDFLVTRCVHAHIENGELAVAVFAAALQLAVLTEANS